MYYGTNPTEHCMLNWDGCDNCRIDETIESREADLKRLVQRIAELKKQRYSIHDNQIIDGYVSCNIEIPSKSGMYRTIVADNSIGRAYNSETLFIVGSGWETENTYIHVTRWKEKE